MDQPKLLNARADFDQLLNRLSRADRFAIDTEFSRESTYFPELNLVQIALDREVFLVDPLGLDLRALGEIFRGDAEVILHAGTQDLEIFEHELGVLPRRIFDTQLAAAFLGDGIASLGKLVQRYLGVRLDKGSQLTDWSRRPLPDRALRYAASDVAYLIALRDELASLLEEQGRIAWALEASESLLKKGFELAPPEEAWWKLRGRNRLRSRAARIAQALAAAREEKARELNLPPKRLLSDLALLAMAESPPDDIEDLAHIRGLDGGRRRGEGARELLRWVEEGRALGADALVLPKERPEERLPSALISLCLAWASQRASDESIELSLLATRADVIEFLTHREGSKLNEGFRYELLGRDLEAIQNGRAAIAFEGEALKLISLE